jgi:hypothetical protein
MKQAEAGAEGRTEPGATGPTNVEAHVLALVETGRLDEAWRLADGFDLREAHDSWELNRFLYARAWCAPPPVIRRARSGTSWSADAASRHATY